MSGLRHIAILLTLHACLSTWTPLAGADTTPPAAPVKLVFVHHSTGGLWLDDSVGGLGSALRDNNYFVSDTYYGWAPADAPESIGDLTDIGHWYHWFLGPNRDLYMSALRNHSEALRDDYYYSRLAGDPGGENRIVMFKSCFPNSQLGGDPSAPATIGTNPLYGEDAWSEYMTVANAKGVYNALLEYFATRTDTLFVAITAPPLVSGDTDASHAANARAFNDWLVNEWLAGYPHANVAVFDFYNVLTSNGGDTHTNDLGRSQGNHHRWWNGAAQHVHSLERNTAAYAGAADDSHPTAAGVQKATAEFVPLLNSYYNRFAAGTNHPEPVTGWVTVHGNVSLDGTPVNALVLANGQFMFSGDPLGSYSLYAPVNSQGLITLYAFAEGMLPYKLSFTPTAADETRNVVMSRCGD